GRHGRRFQLGRAARGRHCGLLLPLGSAADEVQVEAQSSSASAASSYSSVSASSSSAAGASSASTSRGGAARERPPEGFADGASRWSAPHFGHAGTGFFRS